MKRPVQVFLIIISVFGATQFILPTSITISKNNQAFVQEWSPRKLNVLKNELISPPTLEGKDVTISVNPKKGINRINPAVIGLNLNIFEHPDTWQDSNLWSNISNISTSFIRWPGGSNADLYNWSTDGTSEGRLSYFLTVLKKSKAQGIISVNLGEFRKDPVAGAQLAADLVEYLNSPNDGSNPNGGTNWAAKRAEAGFPKPIGLKYFVVGNENFGNWEKGTCDNYPNATPEDCINRLKGSEYISIFKKYVTAMKAVDRSIFIGAPVSGEDNGHFSKDWDKQIITQGKDIIDFYDLHLYSVHAQGRIPSQIIQEAGANTARSIQQFKGLLELYGDLNKPILLGEYNAAGPIFQMLTHDSTEQTSALAIANMIGAGIQNGIEGANYWSGGSIDWNKDYLYWGYNLFSRNAPKTPNLTPYPAYYAMFLWSKMGDSLVDSSSSDPDVYTYASTFSDKSQALMLINNSNQPKQAQIDFKDIIADINSWILEAPDYTSVKTYLNSKTTPGNFGGPNLSTIQPYYKKVNGLKSSHSLPPHSVVLIQAKQTSLADLSLYPEIFFKTPQYFSGYLKNIIIDSPVMNWFNQQNKSK